MRVAYVDSSMLLGILFEEPQHQRLAARIQGFDRMVSANLLEAEVRSALARESMVDSTSTKMLERVKWVLPDRSLGTEINAVLSAGYLRGADLWHLACALYVRGQHDEFGFLTLDRRQEEIAMRLGFCSS